MGLIWANAPSSAVAAVTMKRNPVVLAMKVGNMGEPTTLSSVRPSPANCVCFWRTSRPRCTERSPIRTRGMISTWMMKKRGMMMSPGKRPPHRNETR